MDATFTHVIAEVYGNGAWSQAHAFSVAARDGDEAETMRSALSWLEAMRGLHKGLAFRGQRAVITPKGRVTRVGDLLT